MAAKSMRGLPGGTEVDTGSLAEMLRVVLVAHGEHRGDDQGDNEAIPATGKAKSNRGARELPPEAKIRTAKKAMTAQNAENISGPFTEVRSLRGFPGCWSAKMVPLLQAGRGGLSGLTDADCGARLVHGRILR